MFNLVSVITKNNQVTEVYEQDISEGIKAQLNVTRGLRYKDSDINMTINTSEGPIVKRDFINDEYRLRHLFDRPDFPMLQVFCLAGDFIKEIFGE